VSVPVSVVAFVSDQQSVLVSTPSSTVVHQRFSLLRLVTLRLVKATYAFDEIVSVDVQWMGTATVHDNRRRGSMYIDVGGSEDESVGERVCVCFHPSRIFVPFFVF
jgi:hypothetical protein